MPLIAAAVVVVAAIGVGGFWLMKGSTANAKSQIASPTRTATRPPAPPPVVPQPIIATATQTAAATTATVDPAAQKKAFEDAVNQKLQEQMLKMQTQFDKNLQQKKSKNAAVNTPPAVLTASVAPHRTETLDDRSPSAAAFDERRVAARTDTVAPQIPVPAAVTQPQAPASQPQVATPVPGLTASVKEGDIVKFDELDEHPVLMLQPRIQYPPMAMRQRIESSVILTALISENGDVIDVNILRGDPRFGFNDAAVRAMRTAKFRPAMKDGKRVKTWLPQPIDFKLK
jgi:TonB family protein